MKFLFISFILLLSIHCINAQVTIDLAFKKGNSQTIKTSEKSIRLINCSKVFQYKIDWGFQEQRTPTFNNEGVQSGKDCSDDENNIIQKLKNSEQEDSIKKYVDLGNKLLPTIKDPGCIQKLKQSISETENIVNIPYAPLNYNQIITVTITKIELTGKHEEKSKWVFILKTEEKTRWLIHYGLTYTPSIISKTDNYFAFADTSVSNRYTIKKENDNGPKPWNNISATINFTYPFSTKNKSVDAGFTAGFGLNPDFLLSGHTGLSVIIGDNVILGSGIAFMQKYKLIGQYFENEVIKTNLDFDALHHKVWLPEFYFTIGFRFSQNPFAKKTAEENKTSPNNTNQ